MHRRKICTVRDLSALVTFVRGDGNKRVHQQNVLVLFNTIYMSRKKYALHCLCLDSLQCGFDIICQRLKHSGLSYSMRQKYRFTVIYSKLSIKQMGYNLKLLYC